MLIHDGLPKKYAKYLTGFFKRKILPGFLINKHELVIDLGSGDKPFWRADVCFDNLSLGNEQRASSSDTITDIGVFLSGKLEDTGFKEKIFDFSFCSHVLEHVEDPGRVIAEIIRISKKGYIEVPQGIAEISDPFNAHLWIIFASGKKLIMIRKGKMFHDILSKHILNPNVKLKKEFICLYWEGTIEFELIDELKDENKFYADKLESFEEPGFSHKINRLVSRTVRRLFYNEKDINLESLLINGQVAAKT